MNILKRVAGLSSFLVLGGLASACGGSQTSPSELAEFGAPDREAIVQKALETCKLDSSIDIGTHDPIKNRVTLTDAHFDRPFKTVEMEGVNGFDVSLAQIYYGTLSHRSPTGFLGASISATDPTHRGSVGFGTLYEGDFDISGQKTDTNGLVTFHSRVQESREDPNKTPAITEIVLQIDGNKLKALQLTVPVYVDRGSINVFTGKNETLCLKSARVSAP